MFTCDKWVRCDYITTPCGSVVVVGLSWSRGVPRPFTGSLGLGLEVCCLKITFWINSSLYISVFLSYLIPGSMYQIADNQSIETMDSLTVIKSFWNRMVPPLVDMVGRSFRLWSWSWYCNTVLVFVLLLSIID